MKIEKPTINKQRHRAQTDNYTRAHRHNNKKQRSRSHARLAPLRHRQFGYTGPIDLLHCTPLRPSTWSCEILLKNHFRQTGAVAVQATHTHKHNYVCMYVPKAAATESVSRATMTIERSYRCAYVAIERRKFALCTTLTHICIYTQTHTQAYVCVWSYTCIYVCTYASQM